jgi:hypothetical protein
MVSLDGELRGFVKTIDVISLIGVWLLIVKFSVFIISSALLVAFSTMLQLVRVAVLRVPLKTPVATPVIVTMNHGHQLLITTWQQVF